MNDPHEIWQLGRWIARQQSGAARLGWTGGELILRVHTGRVRFVEGVDSAELCARLSCEPMGNADVLEEARALAGARQIAETFAMGAAKELIQGKLREWLLDPDRELRKLGIYPIFLRFHALSAERLDAPNHQLILATSRLTIAGPVPA